MNLNLIVACDKNKGIGYHGKIPWDLPLERKTFARLTKGSGKNIVLMGRKTYFSIPAKYRPLSDRINIVLSRQKDIVVPSEVIVARCFKEALVKVSEMCDVCDVWVIGGEEVYKEAMDSPYCKYIVLTEIQARFECDRFFPDINLSENLFDEINPERMNLSSKTYNENGLNYVYRIFLNKKCIFLPDSDTSRSSGIIRSRK